MSKSESKSKAKKTKISSADFAVCAASLCKLDKRLGRVIKKVGPVTIEVPKRFSPFHSLARSIVYQQLSGKAAATIFGRVQAAVGEGTLFSPDRVMKVPDDVLRAAGLSRAKLAALRDLCQKTIDGVVPDYAALVTMDDAEIIERLTTIRGIGQWTVEMMLMFSLGRPDVLPIHDLGIRKGYMKIYGGDEMPKPKALEAFGEKWRPHRTAASWYLWRVLEI